MIVLVKRTHALSALMAAQARATAISPLTRVELEPAEAEAIRLHLEKGKGDDAVEFDPAAVTAPTDAPQPKKGRGRPKKEAEEPVVSHPVEPGSVDLEPVKIVYAPGPGE